jgi:hypothetical protein
MMDARAVIDQCRMTHKQEGFEFYWNPLLDGRHNQELRNEIFKILNGITPERRITTHDIINELKMNFNQLNLFDNL